MKRLLPVLAVALLLSTSAAFAEDGAGGPPPGAPPAQGSGPQGGGEGRGKWEGMSEEQKKEKFGEFKAKRIAKIKEHLACVEKAADFEAMKACHPHGGKGGGKGGWGKRGGGEGRGPGGPGGEGPGGEE
jgi:hypothetical protein